MTEPVVPSDEAKLAARNAFKRAVCDGSPEQKSLWSQLFAYAKREEADIWHYVLAAAYEIDRARPALPAPEPPLPESGGTAETPGELADLRTAIRAALCELGEPQPGYPAPVANAVEILRAALQDVRERFPPSPSPEAIDAAVVWVQRITPVNMTLEGYRNWARLILETAYAVDGVGAPPVPAAPTHGGPPMTLRECMDAEDSVSAPAIPAAPDSEAERLRGWLNRIATAAADADYLRELAMLALEGKEPWDQGVNTVVPRGSAPAAAPAGQDDLIRETLERVGRPVHAELHEGTVMIPWEEYNALLKAATRVVSGLPAEPAPPDVQEKKPA